MEKQITLDLSGHTFTSTASDGFIIMSGGKLNITGNGTMIHHGSDDLFWVYDGTLTIENGQFEGNGSYGIIYESSGGVTINGGLFSVADNIKGYIARETEGGYYYKQLLTINWLDLVTETTAYAVYDETAKAITISSEEQLALLAKEVNGGNSYQGWTITLSADMDLKGNIVETETQVSYYEWTPIGKSGKSFQGAFDGNNHTIKNLRVTGKGLSDRGFFGITQNGSIQNMVFENAYVEGYLDVGVVAGTPYTSSYENITVKGDIIVDAYAYVGGMFGKNLYANATNLTLNANEGSYVKADSSDYRTYVGGIIGFMGEGNHTVSNVSSNIDVYGSTCDVGGITGIAHYNNSFINVTCTANVYITSYSDEGDQLEMGGIAGVWHNSNGTSVTLKDCSFTGTLTATRANGSVYDGPWNKNGLVGRQYLTDGTGTLMIENCFVNSIEVK